VVGRCKCSKLRWEVAKNCKWWKLQQTTKREAVTNFFHNVFFKKVSFQNVFFQNVFFLNVFCSRDLQRTAVESYNTLQPGSAVGIWCKLRNEFATNWGWKLQQTSNGSCNNLRNAVGSCDNLRLEVAINCGRKLQQTASGKLQQTVNGTCNKALIAVVSCNELRLEFATNCGYNRHKLRTAAVGS
jgi:hypothetical protein